MKKISAVLLLLTMAFVSVPAQKIRSLDNRTVQFNRAFVSYSDIAATADRSGVILRWTTKEETQNLGFQIYRVIGGQKNLISQSFVSGAYLQARDQKITNGNYSFYDAEGNFSTAYIIESINLNGAKQSTTLIRPQSVGGADLPNPNGKNSSEARPFVFSNDTVLPSDLSDEVQTLTVPPDVATQRFIASQPGVKIGVKSEGFYRITREQLAAAGFNVLSPSQLWQLYVNGVEQAITVGANDAYIEFYGKGIDREESDTQIYFLISEIQSGKRIGSTFRLPNSSPVQSFNYNQSFTKQERFIYSSGILNGDGHNFFGTVINNSGGTVNFNLTGVDFNAPVSSIDLTIQGLTQTAHQIRIALNGTELGMVSGTSTNQILQSFNVPTALLQEGANALTLTALNAGDVSFFDSVKVNFARRYRADQNKLSFFVPNYKAVYAENFASANIRVFDTTNPSTPILINNLAKEQANGAYRVYLPPNRGRVMYAVEDSGLLAPASIILNEPSTLSNAAHNAELVIISHRNFLNEANAWANYRRSQGMTVEVVNAEDVYDEFGFGVFSTDAIKGFLQFAKENWQTPPRYALLIGDATYDPRNFVGAGANNYVPTRMVDTIYLQTGSDEALADFDDDGLAEVAIGRIPVTTAPLAALMLNKTIAFEQTVAQAQTRGAIFASDLPNGYDFEALSSRLCDQMPSSINCIKINRGAANAHTNLIAEMNTGRFLVNYSGHGNTQAWAADNFFYAPDAAALTNGNNLSIFTMLTCLNGFFMSPTDSLAEVLLKNPNGGAVSVWASSGLTTADIQEVMATRYYSQIAATGNTMRLGDLVKDAKTTINFGRDVRLSWALLGDPSLKVR